MTVIQPIAIFVHAIDVAKLFIITSSLQTEGKKANIRALLCSLHTVVWEDCRWNRCDMSQLVSAADVKRNYRKACLAVHPDKVTSFRPIYVALLASSQY